MPRTVARDSASKPLRYQMAGQPALNKDSKRTGFNGCPPGRHGIPGVSADARARAAYYGNRETQWRPRTV
eukprot:21130-Hanusia_phi.AAC.5